MEDIIEEVEVVVEEEQGKLSSQEPEEKLEEQGQEHPRTGTSSDQPPLEAREVLAVLQVQLSSPSEKDPQPIFGYRGRPIKEKVSLESEKCLYPGQRWLVGQSCILSVACSGTGARGGVGVREPAS